MGMTISQWENADRRQNPRVRLHLRLAVVYPQREGRPYRPIHHGTTHDICMSGLSMVVEENAYHEGEVSVLLALPPVHSWASPKIITAKAEMTYAFYSSKLNAFKIGLVFRKFTDSGKELLSAALEHASGQADSIDMHGAGDGPRAVLPVDSQPLDC